MRPHPGNDLSLGQVTGRTAPLILPAELRDKHLYVCGSTGMGKSKFLENLLRQDIIGWRKSRCGLLLLDPHGSLYDDLLNWLAWNEIDRPIIPIDLRQDDWIVSYNLLRQRSIADPNVLVDNITDAMAYVWGQGGVNQTPLFARWAGNVIRALYEKELSLVEAEYLVDRVAKQIRYALTADLKDKPARQDWQFADTLTAKDFESQIGSTINRLQRFIRNQTMRSMFGQLGVSFDFAKALEEGSIILVNLATERARISKTNAELFATLLLSDLWTAAQERGKRKGVKPFYVYLDEFQRFVTPTISDNLDEARGFGLHLTMAHQFPNQLLDRGESGRRVYNSIMENASSKVVFHLSHSENLKVMAEWLFMGTMNPDEIKHELYATKVMSYREEMREIYGEIFGTGRGRGSQTGHAEGAGFGATQLFSPDGTPLTASESWSRFASDSGSENQFEQESESHSHSTHSMLIPVMGKELAHVQFRSLEEQLFRAMAVLFDQQERQCIGRLVNMRAPLSLVTPTVRDTPASEARVKRYLERCYKKLPFALPSAKAQQLLADRDQTFVENLLKEFADEPKTAKRRIR
jgi:hypothetical protein